MSSQADKRIIICPKCQSEDVSWTLSKEAYAQGSIFNQRKCNSCGYTGIMFPEFTEKELEKIRKKEEK